MAPAKISIYERLLQYKSASKKCFAVLIDPDKVSDTSLRETIELCVLHHVDFILVGGSLVTTGQVDMVVATIKGLCSIPVILFPGNPSQVTPSADALLYLSLISGRNPDLLIGQHVVSAPMVRQSGLEILPTGYMVVDGGAPTTVSYISNATPLPADKPDIAQCTAMAGEMLGMKIIYMDAGSGARRPVHTDLIKKVRAGVSIPLIVGGGITTAELAYDACRAGADVIVIGNAIEKDASLIKEMASAIHGHKVSV